jgi:hypothetical protein
MSFAGNPAHLAVVAVTLVILLVRGYREDRRAVAIYALALTLSFLTFCALLKWQPTIARLQLPLFVLWSAAVGVVIGNAWPAVLARVLAAMLLLLAVPIATGNDSRSVTSSRERGVLKADRPHLYFGDRPSVAGEYLAAVGFAKGTGCRNIGLDLSGSVGGQYEYPLLVLLDAGAGARVEAVDVSNASRPYTRRNARFEPCRDLRALRADRDCRIVRWQRVTATNFGDIVVFTPGAKR